MPDLGGMKIVNKSGFSISGKGRKENSLCTSPCSRCSLWLNFNFQPVAKGWFYHGGHGDHEIARRAQRRLFRGVNHPGNFSYYVILRYKAPVPGVDGVIPVIAHHE